MRRRAVLVALVAPLLLAGAAEDRWTVDRDTSAITLSVRALGGQSSGRFEDWRSTIAFDPAAPERTRGDVTAAVASLKLRPRAATARAVGPGLLDAARHPTIRLRLRSLTPTGGSTYAARADVTVKGVTRPIAFPVDLRVAGDRAQMTGGFDIDRADFGIGTTGPWNRLVGRQVNVRVMLTARRAD